jgi:hypothetical protein
MPDSGNYLIPLSVGSPAETVRGSNSITRRNLAVVYIAFARIGFMISIP